MTSLTRCDLSADHARRITDQIKVAVEGTWELIRQAYDGRVWIALGYPSWDDYCTREFGTSRLKLPREDRQEVVASLRESGLSIRAIAAATGESPRTVGRALSGVAFATPDVDLKDDLDWDDDDEDEEVSVDPVPPTPKITGMDGKQYEATKPVAARQRSLPDAFFDATHDLGKVVDRLERLVADPRFMRNKEQVARHRSDLLSIIDAMTDVANRLA